MRHANINIHRPEVLLVLIVVGVLSIGLLALVSAKPAWAASRTFEPALNSPFSVGSTPTTVTNADFDGDGKMDLAAQNAGSNTVSVRMGNGDGTFQTKPDVTVGSGPTSVTSADLNDDGKADIAVSNQFSNTVSVVLGNGDGTFQAKQDFAVERSPTSVISAKFNSDGYADLAVANSSSNTVTVLLGQDSNGDGKADGTFQTAGSFPIDSPCTGTLCYLTTMTSPNQVISADLNGDNKVDLATANLKLCGPLNLCNPGGVSVLLGNGNGTFQSPRELIESTANSISSIAATHIDTGNSVDLVATKFDSNVALILRGNGDGTFQSPQSLGVGNNPSAVTSEDLDGDNKADLAVSNFGSDNISILFNDGSGGFQSAQNFPVGDGPVFVISARLNGDDFKDLAVANQNSNNVSVLLNTTVPPETIITSGPSGRVNSTSATFEFSSSVANSTFKCRVSGGVFGTGAWSDCQSPWNIGPLAEASYTFEVFAIDPAGNPDPTPPTRNWTVDTAAPMVSNVSPANAATDVAPGATIEATFPEAMNSSTLSASTFALKKQGSSTAVAATVSYDVKTNKATLDPDSNLAANTTYMATVKGGANGVKDTAGNALQQDYTWTFTTAIPPETTITAGPSGRVNSTQATFEFTSSVADSTFRCRVSGGGWGAGTWSDCHSPLNIGPQAEAAYTFEVYTIAPTGTADPTPAKRTWTVDTAAPTVVSTSPTTRATGVARGTNVSATFSEKMALASITKSTLKLYKCASTTSSTCTTQVTNVTVTLSADGLKAILNPYGTSSTLLAKNTKYKAVVTTVVKDLAGNALDQNATTSGNQPKTWTFVTGST